MPKVTCSDFPMESFENLLSAGIIVDFGKKKKHLKKAPFQGKKSTFLAKIAPISQTKNTFGAEEKSN